MTPRSNHPSWSVAAVVSLMLAGCGHNAGSTVGTVSQGSATTETSSATAEGVPAGCHQPPSVGLTAAGATIPMAMVFYGESTQSCGLDVDGDAMFDPSFHPEHVLLAPDGTINVTVDGDGELMQDVQPFEPTMVVAGIKPTTAVTADSDGSYPVTLPGAGCFVVTIGWQAEGRTGQFASLVETSPTICRTD